METKREQPATTFTKIYHLPLEKLKLSPTEYMLADTIYRLSRPDNHQEGWCWMKKEKLAKQFHITTRQLLNICNTLITKKLIVKDDRTGFLKTTALWFDEVVAPNMLG
jgi:hypothetical protein